MNNELFYIIFTPIVIALFVYAYRTDKSFNNAVNKAEDFEGSR